MILRTSILLIASCLVSCAGGTISPGGGTLAGGGGSGGSSGISASYTGTVTLTNNANTFAGTLLYPKPHSFTNYLADTNGNLYFSNGSLLANTSAQLNCNMISDSDYWSTFYLGGDGTGGPNYVANFAGANFGIGTSNPFYKLDVRGPIGNYEYGNANNIQLDSGSGNMIFNSTTDMYFQQGSPGLIHFIFGGKVGIYTYAPIYSLDVSGYGNDGAIGDSVYGTFSIVNDTAGNGGSTLQLKASDNGTKMYLHVTSTGIATWTTFP